MNRASLQRLALLRLGRQLTKKALQLRHGLQSREPDSGDYEHSVMHNYALQDWEYIKKCALRTQAQDPFMLVVEKRDDNAHIGERIRACQADSHANMEEDSSLFQDSFVGGERPSPSTQVDKTVYTISREMEFSTRYAPEAAMMTQNLIALSRRQPPKHRGKLQLLGGSRHELNRKRAFEAFLQRIGMAMLGSVFLVGPMLIMVFIPGLLASVLTTGLFVMAFGL